MTTEQFVYWLQGFAELNAEPPTVEQWQAIRDHLQLVFEKKTPPFPVKVNQDGNKNIADCIGKFNQAWPFYDQPRITC